MFLIIKYLNNTRYEHDLIRNNYYTPYFFDLGRINPILFHLQSLLLPFLGSWIVYFLYFTMIKRVKLVALDNNRNLLNLLLFFGLFSNFVLLLFGILPYLNNFESINNEVKQEINFNLSEMLFIIYNFLSCLYFIISIYESDKLVKMSIDKNKYYKWKNIKIIVVIYMLIFTILYLLVNTYKDKFKSDEGLFIKINYCLIVLPYLINCLHSIFIVTFYFELNQNKLFFVSLIQKKNNFFQENVKNTL